MSIRRACVLVTALTALLLTGCAGADSPAGGTGSASTAAPGTTPTSAPDRAGPDETGPPVLPTRKPGTPTTAMPPGGPGTGPQTLTGTVVSGVEPGCLLLRGSDGGNHLLLFSGKADPSSAPVGATVTVVGRAEPGMITTCQQGTPFVVSEVRPG
jgi:hypothetical protein